MRLDGGFATPKIFDFLDAEPRLDYVVAMAKNAVSQRHAEHARGESVPPRPRTQAFRTDNQFHPAGTRRQRRSPRRVRDDHSVRDQLGAIRNSPG